MSKKSFSIFCVGRQMQLHMQEERMRRAEICLVSICFRGRTQRDGWSSQKADCYFPVRSADLLVYRHVTVESETCR